MDTMKLWVLRAETKSLPENKHRHPEKTYRGPFVLATIFILTFLSLGAGTYSFKQSWWTSIAVHRNETAYSACTRRHIVPRREWRHLTTDERISYLDAVQCLQGHEGRIFAKQSVFEDFAYSHSRLGNNSHHSALFLPWHRMFLYAYESALQKDCNFTSSIPYWDWSLDHGDLPSSPVWDAAHGFGGNGTRSLLNSSLRSVGDGFCVTDGPFANRTPRYLSDRERPHCLSRGFTLEGTIGKEIPGKAITPARIEHVLVQPSYAAFWEELENGPHDAIPHFVRGDFLFLTAPNDPVFFLHHAQLDRLWWLWQQRAYKTRIMDYTGRRHAFSDEPASLSDPIEIGEALGSTKEGLLNGRVEDVMSTNGEGPMGLCLAYL